LGGPPIATELVLLSYPIWSRSVKWGGAFAYGAPGFNCRTREITLFFLPPYSPDLNADEWVWKQVKQRIARQTVRTREDLKRVALSPEFDS